jgi:hypothetical protein
VLNHQIIICAVSRHWSVTISRRGMEFLSFRLYISRTIDSRFHIPSGSRPIDTHKAFSKQQGLKKKKLNLENFLKPKEKNGRAL